MSRAQEARERRYEKGLKWIAECLLANVRRDARDEARDTGRDYEECYEMFLEDYKTSVFEELDCAIEEAVDY
jgi:hypothetical protein